MTGKRRDGPLKSVLTALTLRGVALGGRFVFVIFATKYMLPQDFGRFGLLAALAAFIPVLVGLEAYQVLLRRILQEPERAPDTRRFYANFALAGSLASGAIGSLTLAVFGWSATDIALGALVLMLEHIGLEVCRNLVNERLPTLSVLSVALRTGGWGVAVPSLFFVGLIPAPWTFETVLWFWIVSAIGAVFVGRPIWRLFRPDCHDLCHKWGVLKEVADLSRTWLVYNLSLRCIEFGGRFVCAWMISDAAAGRFTFVSMMASLSYLAQKGAVEPIYYPRLCSLDATKDTDRQFRRINLAVVIGGTMCSILSLGASAWLNAEVPPESELMSFGLLCLAFAGLSLSQPAHYQLYRWSRDRAIMTSALVGCIATILGSVAATWFWGIVGAAAGTLLGSLVLLFLKGFAARKLVR